MLPGDDVVAVPYLGVEPPELEHLLPDAHVWVSSLHPDEAGPILQRLESSAELVSIPLLLLTGFHPDIVHVVTGRGHRGGVGSPGAEARPSWRGGGSTAGPSTRSWAAVDTRGLRPRWATSLAWEGGVRQARYGFDEADCDFRKTAVTSPLAVEGPRVRAHSTTTPQGRPWSSSLESRPGRWAPILARGPTCGS